MIRSAGIYALSNVINAAVPFLLLPVLTAYLSPAEYGIVTMFLVLVNAVLPFSGFSLDGAISRQYFDRDESDFPMYISNGIFILLGSSTILYFLFEVGSNYFEQWTQFPAYWMWAVVLFALFQKWTDVLLAVWRVQDKPISYGIFRVLRTCLDLGLSMYFIIQMKRSWEGRVEGQLFAVALFAALAFFFLYRMGCFKWKWNRAYFDELLKFGLPLIPHALGAVIITYSDRLFITNMIGLTEMGLYAVGYQIGMVIGLIQNSFNQAWQPWLYQKLKDDQMQEKVRIVKFTYAYFAIILIAVLFLTLAGPLIIDWMTDTQYQGAGQYIVWIGLGFAFNGMYKMVGNYLFYLRKTKVIGLITGLTALLNLALNYLLIKAFGAIGAAQATAITFFIQFCSVWWISAKAYPMPWNLKE